MTNENNNEFLPETEEEVVETIEETTESTEEAAREEKPAGEEELVEDAIRRIKNGEAAAIGFIGDDAEEKEPKKEKSFAREVLEWVLVLGIAAILALFIRNFIFTLVEVDGNSMLPTLHHQERLVVTRLGYEPERGDIIVFKHTESHIDANGKIVEKEVAYVKRIIGIEGDTVSIDYDTNTVYVNGEALEEDYIDQIMEYRGPEGEVRVPEDSVFVLGDNRNNSKDSRFAEVGFVDEDLIIGEAKLRIWPFNSFGVVE